MKDEDKTKKQLITELIDFRGRILKLQKAESQETSETQCRMRKVTECRQAGEAFQRAEELYRFLAENTNDMISRHLPDSTYLYVSPVCQTLFGYEPEELIGTKAFDQIHPDDVKRIIAISQEAVRSGGTDMGQYRHLKKDGQYVWVETVGKVIKDEATGNVEDIICVVRDISERKLSELHLAETQAHLLAMLESTDDFIWSVDSQYYGLITFNHGLAKHFSTNYGLELRTGMTPDDLLPPTRAIVWYEFYQRALREGSFSTEYVVMAGTKILLLAFNLLRRNEEVFGISVFGKDITKRKQAEETLRASQQLIEGIINAISVRVFWKDKNLVYIGCNAAFARDAGFLDPKDIIGKDDYQMGWRDQAELYRNDDRQVIDYGVTKYLIEEPQTTPEGNTITLLTSKLPLRNSKGEISGVLGTYIDITELKKTEEALQEASKFNRQIIESAKEGIIVYAPDLKYQVWNPYMEQLTGLPAGEVLGRHPLEIFPFLRETGAMATLEKALAGEINEAERIHFHIPKTGRSGWTSDISAPLRNAKGEIVGVIGTVRDITEHVKLEDQLRHAQKMEAVGTLAGGIAHDFNNILNVIMGYGTLAQNSLDAGSPSKEQMDEVLKAADKAATLIRRLLAFSRRQVIEVKPFNINDLVLGLQKMLVRIIGEDIDLQLNLMGRSLVVLADPSQIEQVLMNLATNARDAMPNGGRLGISTGLEEIDDEYVAVYGYGKAGMYAHIMVSDTGSGIDEETQKKMFEPFYTTKGVGEGTGLGLAISYGIIKQHGGYIRAYSELGQGTVVKVYLPLMKEAAVVDKQAETSHAARGGDETILVAEDDAALRNLIRIVLESSGYSVISAEDGEDAIIKFTDNRDKIALVVLDMIMPRKSGKEVSDAIRKVSPLIKILFSSGYAEATMKTEELTASGFDFIQKPVMPHRLLSQVREVLDK
ncbi:MAG: PAS domain S-box protein [Dissulfurispiraceae bacterium]